MRLTTITASPEGVISQSLGINISKGTGKTGFFDIGRDNPGHHMMRVRVGENLIERLKYDAPCSKDGEGDVLGKCSECGIDITEEIRVKGPTKKYPGSDIEITTYMAPHTFSTKLKRAVCGTILPVTVAGVERLLLVEERPKDRFGRVGILFYAEPRHGRRTAIIAPPQRGAFAKAVGQVWSGKTPQDGVGVQRLMIMKPDDQVSVVYFIHDIMDKNATKYTYTVGKDLSLHSVTEVAPVVEKAVVPATDEEVYSGLC